MITHKKNKRYSINKRKLLCWIFLFVGVYTIFPFLFLCQYNQPSADDFTLAVRDSSTPLTVVLTDVYNNWSGRFLAPVISRLNPLLYNPGLYKLYPFVLILSFVASVIILIRELLKSTSSLLEILAISSISVYLIISQTPSIPEAFYWFSGSCIYQTANIATLILITVLCRLKKTTSAPVKITYTFITALLCIFIIGCNEISMVIVCFIILHFAFYKYFTLKRVNFSSLILSIICLLFSAVVVFAPGNFSRISDPAYFNKSISWTVFGAGSVTGLYLVKWSASLLTATLVYFMFQKKNLLKRSDNHQESKLNLQWVTFLSIAAFFAIQMIIFFTAGGGNLGRIENNMYLFFLLIYFAALHLFINKNARKLSDLSFPKIVSVFTMLLFLSDVFNVENNVSSAYIDIFSGRAKKYETELHERLVIAKNCKKDTCIVPSLSATPKSLFVTDIRPASDSMFTWINEGYSQFYKTPYIIPSAELPPVEPNFEIIRHLGKEIRKNMVIK